MKSKWSVMRGAWRANPGSAPIMRRIPRAVALGLALLLLAGLASAPTHSVSESIAVWFTPGTRHDGTNTSPKKEALLAFLGSARSSIDIAIFNLRDEQVIARLNEIARAGVVSIRIVTDDKNHPIEGSSGTTLHRAIRARRDNSDLHMHNKFVIVDNAAVWTGSGNFTRPSFTTEDNDAILIRSVPVANAFLAEFEQMWNGRFQTAKVASGNVNFTVNGIPIEVRFAPQDRPLDRLKALVTGANASLYFAVYTFADDDLANTFVARRRLAHLGILDQVGLGFAGVAPTPHDILRGGGFDAMVIAPPDGGNRVQIHHKFAAIDGFTVATGSMNFTGQANVGNDENHVVLHHAAFADSYIAAALRLAGRDAAAAPGAGAPGAPGAAAAFNPTTYPNPFRPSRGTLTITSGAAVRLREAKIYAMDGRLLVSLPGRNEPTIIWDGRNSRGEHLGSGTYYIEIMPADGRPVRRLFTLVR